MGHINSLNGGDREDTHRVGAPFCMRLIFLIGGLSSIVKKIKIKLWVERVGNFIHRLSVLVVELVAVLVILLCVVLLIKDIVDATRKRSVLIQPFETPIVLRESGITSAVLTNRVLDKIHEMENRATSESYWARPYRVVPSIGTYDIRVSNTGFSFQDVSTAFLKALGLAPIEISGDIVSIDGEYSIVLRIDKIDDSSRIREWEMGARGGSIDSVFQCMAESILCSIDPGVLAYDLFGRGAFESSLGITSHLLRSCDKNDSLKALRVWGHNLMAQGHYASALEKYKTITALDPGNMMGHYNCGVTYYQLNQYDSAIMEYKEALLISDADVYSYISWGYALIGKGQSDSAIGEFERAIELDSNSSDAYEGYAAALYSKRDYANSIKYYRKAIELGKPDPVIQYEIGSAFIAIGQDDSALHHYERAICGDSQHYLFYNSLAELLIKKRQFSEAKKTLQRALSVCVVDINIRHDAEYFQVIDFRSDSSLEKARCYYNYGVVSDSLGEYDEATAAYIKVLGIGQSGNYADKARQALTRRKSKGK